MTKLRIVISGMQVEELKNLENFLNNDCIIIKPSIPETEPPIIEVTDIHMMDSNGAIGSGLENYMLFQVTIEVNEVEGTYITPLVILGALLQHCGESIGIQDVTFEKIKGDTKTD